MSIDNIKLKAAADILGGAVFFANEYGVDPEYTSNDGLLPNGMYIRLEGSDGSLAYISAYELDKAIGIIAGMTASKADAATVASLQALLDDKVSTTDFQLLSSDVEGKASKAELDDALDTFGGKADQTAVDAIIEELNAKANQETIDAINAALEGKAEQSDVDALQTLVAAKAELETVSGLLADVIALKATVETLTNVDSIAAINNQIAYLNSEIQRRLTIDDLTTIKTNIANLTTSNETLSERVGNVEANLSKKATTTYVQGQVTELNTAITGIAARMGDKADKSDLANKANKSDLDSVTSKVKTLNSTISDLEVLIDNNYDELAGDISEKADASYVNTKVTEFTDELSNKADKTTVNTSISALNTKVNTLEDNYSTAIGDVSGSIEELECEVNNVLAELRANINTQSRNITTQGNKITNLETASNTYKDQLKQTWVRVLSTNEYKKLTTPPEGVPYNSRYKYPNTVYLVVDFNKPKAIYIGDILVAQAEQKGSIGFAYTFPIVF